MGREKEDNVNFARALHEEREKRNLVREQVTWHSWCYKKILSWEKETGTSKKTRFMVCLCSLVCFFLRQWFDLSFFAGFFGPAINQSTTRRHSEIFQLTICRAQHVRSAVQRVQHLPDGHVRHGEALAHRLDPTIPDGRCAGRFWLGAFGRVLVTARVRQRRGAHRSSLLRTTTTAATDHDRHPRPECTRQSSRPPRPLSGARGFRRVFGAYYCYYCCRCWMMMKRRTPSDELLRWPLLQKYREKWERETHNQRPD